MSGGIIFDLWALGFAALVAGVVWWVSFLALRRMDKPDKWDPPPALRIVKTPEDWAEHEDWVR